MSISDILYCSLPKITNIIREINEHASQPAISSFLIALLLNMSKTGGSFRTNLNLESEHASLLRGFPAWRTKVLQKLTRTSVLFSCRHTVLLLRKWIPLQKRAFCKCPPLRYYPIFLLLTGSFVFISVYPRTFSFNNVYGKCVSMGLT